MKIKEEEQEKQEQKEEEEEQIYLYEVIINKISHFLLVFILGLACGYCWCWNALGQKIGG